MAADIAYFDEPRILVGDDQKQHVEIARDIAQKFNSDFKTDYFPIPEPLIMADAPRIMSLRDGTKKMSKSDPSDYSRITMTEAERLYGVTMEEEGVSCRVVVKIAEANRWVEEKIPAQQRATSATSSAGSPAARDPFLDRGTTKRGITVDVDESTSPQS